MKDLVCLNGEHVKWHIHAKHIGEVQNTPQYKPPSQMKDSYKPDIWTYPKSTSLCIIVVEPPCTERYARWCGRSAAQLLGCLLPDYYAVSISKIVTLRIIVTVFIAWCPENARGKRLFRCTFSIPLL